MTDIAQLRFLVVEDQGFQRWLVANVLKEFGVQSIIAASDGAEALSLIRGQPVDVVISDLDMPEMDGMELIRGIAQLGKPIDVILMSSHDRSLMSTVESMAKAYNVKVLGAIRKPLTPRKLEGVLGILAGGGKGPSPVPQTSILITAAEAEQALRNAEFETYFQPKVEVKTGRVRGAEALARWRHPTQGLLGPSAFLPLVESAGMIEALTACIAGDALRACLEWRKAGIPASVSINLSVSSLSDVSLADRLTAIASEISLEPAHVTFEVTESATAREQGPALENLSRLMMKGFGLSIDYFGTGYSSMARLTRVPFTELKIDQSFVAKAISEASSRAMVESSLDLARKLGIAAVAEGVESAAQWSLLLTLGCDQAQGYYIAHPMTAADFRRWARERSGSAAG